MLVVNYILSRKSLVEGRLPDNQNRNDSFCIKFQSNQSWQVTYALTASFTDLALATVHSIGRNTSPQAG